MFKILDDLLLVWIRVLTSDFKFELEYRKWILEIDILNQILLILLTFNALLIFCERYSFVAQDFSLVCGFTLTSNLHLEGLSMDPIMVSKI